MKKSISLLLIIFNLMIFTPKDSHAQLCEFPNTLDLALQGVETTEKAAIKLTTETISLALGRVKSAINRESKSIANLFAKFADQEIEYLDALVKMKIIREQKVAITRSQLKNRVRDFYNRACEKATNSKNWSLSKATTRRAKESAVNSFLKASNNNNKDVINFSKSAADKHTLWFSKLVPNTTDSNHFFNADVSSNSVFGHSTFKNKTSAKAIPVKDPYKTPNTLTAAKVYIQNLTGAQNIQKPPAHSKVELAKYTRDVARRNLVFSALMDTVSRRTAFKDSKTGEWLRVKYSELSKDGVEYSKDIAKTIADDISEYELQDHLYSKLYTNPDWVISLEAPGKSLQMEELEIINKNMALEWDTLLTLEKLATVESVALATQIDKQE